MDQAPAHAATSLLTPARRRSKGRLPACESGFLSSRKQACRAESRAAVSRDGSSQAQRPSSSDTGVNAHD